MHSDKFNRYTINSITRACQLLMCFNKDDTRFKPSELAKLLDLDRSTVYRILLSLEKCGMVERDASTGRYSLGVALLKMGMVYLRSTNLTSIAHPLMIELAAKVKDTVNLTVLSGNQVLYIDKVDSPRSLGILTEVGSLLPLYCTGVGKTLLAYQPADKIDRYIDTCEFTARTKNTITSQKQFRRELKKIQQQGYAQDHREWADEIMCFAAPIFNYREEIIAALSVSGPYLGMAEAGMHAEIIQHVKTVANIISAKMGCHQTTA